jgi:hypothetical protein
MATVMITLQLEPEQASLDNVRRLLGLVEERAAERVRNAAPVKGVFSNPKIEPS